jgi:hypothetical protein
LERAQTVLFYLRERLSLQATIDKLKFDNSFGSPRRLFSELVWHHQVRGGGSFMMKILSQAVRKSEGSGRPEVFRRRCYGEQDMRDLLKFNEEDFFSPFGNLPAVDAFLVTKAPFFDCENGTRKPSWWDFSCKQEHALRGSQVSQWITIAKKAHPGVTKIVVVFVMITEDLAGWNVQAFKMNDKKGMWRNYNNLPADLQEVQQIGLGIPKDGRDTNA